MNQSVGTFAKGMAAGLIVASTVAVAMQPKNNKKVATAKKKASKTIHAIGTALDTFNL